MPEYIPRGATTRMVDAMTRAYLDCAAWADLMEEDRTSFEACREPHWTLAAVREAVKVCEDFRKRAGAMLDGWTDTQVGHDLWLSRNGHGAGFFDRDMPHAEKLQEIARRFGECHVEWRRPYLNFY